MTDSGLSSGNVSESQGEKKRGQEFWATGNSRLAAGDEREPVIYFCFCLMQVFTDIMRVLDVFFFFFLMWYNCSILLCLSMSLNLRSGIGKTTILSRILLDLV